MSALYRAAKPGSVFFAAWMATATMPSWTATLLISAPVEMVEASMVPMCLGLAGVLRSSTSTTPLRALTTKPRLLAASKAGISAALTPNWPAE